jgi:predicted nuclease of restriction endonuclease-like (RecB) superfamily
MIASHLHERSQPALTTFDQAVAEADREAVREIVKDPFILDFLAADPVRERDLSKALIDNLVQFLRELGTGFAFVGVEVPIKSGEREFFIDLLFYHCKLHRYVVFELKLGRFEPEYVGKLNFYVQLVDDHLRDQARDDPTLGMLLVVGRDDVTVEVALRGLSTPLAVTEWRRLPAKVRQALPTADDLSATVTRTVREVESAADAALSPRFAQWQGRGPRMVRLRFPSLNSRANSALSTHDDVPASTAASRARSRSKATWRQRRPRSTPAAFACIISRASSV